jgi:Secretion system C-terminal sorting domain
MKKLITIVKALLLFNAGIFAQSTTSLRADGTILVNGQPFFPFGAYAVHWDAPGTERINCLNALIAAGMNVAQIEDAGSSGANFADLLNIADANNFHFFVGVSYSPNIVSTAAAYKNRNCILAWSLADDGDDASWTIDQLKSRNSSVKSADPNHLTFLPLTGYDATRRRNVGNYTPIADASALEIYPIGAPSGYDVNTSNALTQTYLRTLAYVNSATALRKPMLMLPQTFSWGRQAPNPRYPTVNELRNMIYAGIAAGVKGIMSYDFSFDLVNNQSALWNEFKAIRTDVLTLQSALMDGELTRVNTGDEALVASYWVYNGSVYVTVLNTSYSTAKNVSITLPSGTSGTATSLFSRMPNTLSFNGGVLSGSIAATQVQVYKLSYSTTGTGGNNNNPATIINFEDRPAGETQLTGTYANANWGNNQWATLTSTSASPVSKVMEMWSLATKQTTQTFTLPAGKKLKSVDIAVEGNPTTKSIEISSKGNPTLTFNDMTNSFKTYNTGWTVAAPVVTVKVTCNLGAAYVVLDNIVYNNGGSLRTPLLTTPLAENKKLEVTVFPNPSNSEVTISNLKENSIIKIYTADGKLVKTISSPNGEALKLDVHAFNKGTYKFIISSGRLQLNKTVIIQ